MNHLFRTLGVVALTVGALAVPAAAQAAAAPAVLGTATDVDAAGKPIPFPIQRGESVPVTVGVHNYGAEPVSGVLVRIYALNDLDLPKDFTNCRYFTDSNLDGAWCSFDGELAAGGTYATAQFEIAATPDAQPDRVQSVIFSWTPKAEADLGGDIDALAAADSSGGVVPVAGTKTALTLAPRALTVPAQPSRVGFAYPRLVTPSATASPTASPAATASGTAAAPAPTSTPTSAPAPGGEGGGLPVTGANTAVIAGVGALLVLAGTIGFLLARRRTRFIS
ncbi:LPXTG cell wall anchor domain-containing protein [Catenuloplanes atrovinosus]|uniref:LPXTG-motif cell wall-anchored protein n=1 Tax=Catenuloplanes atrovinosus TaxID=137266 RepID=A0AAE3YJ06_9ACTN|nr:LPXTG cell wall anchor domain-containing protein [Catenuloplanes atrovinosus]MDR7273817.1 LPXTG-motif cell wall-anchored protein [Catenuloplanes atrovinosus]